MDYLIVIEPDTSLNNSDGDDINMDEAYILQPLGFVDVDDNDFHFYVSDPNGLCYQMKEQHLYATSWDDFQLKVRLYNCRCPTFIQHQRHGQSAARADLHKFIDHSDCECDTEGVGQEWFYGIIAKLRATIPQKKPLNDDDDDDYMDDQCNECVN